MNRNYRAGRRFEYAVKKELSAGSVACIRAAGSHGAFDLVVFYRKLVYAVQCKNRAPTAEERRKLKLVRDQIDQPGVLVCFAYPTPESRIVLEWVK